MTTYTQQAGSYHTSNPRRVSPAALLALLGGGALAALLYFAALPLLVSAGMWLLGLALLLLGHAFIANRRTAAAGWGSAIAAQGVGLLGLALLLGAAVLG